MSIKRILSLVICLLMMVSSVMVVPVAAADDLISDVALITENLIEVRFNKNVTGIDSKSDFRIYINGTQLATSRYSFWNYMDMIYSEHTSAHEYVATLSLNEAQLPENASKIQVQITDSSVQDSSGTKIDTTKKYQVVYDPHYKKKLVTNSGVVIKAPGEVLDSTVIAAGRQVDIMLSYNKDIADTLARMGASLAIIAATKNAYTVPEHRQGAYEGGYFAEGYGGTVWNDCTSSITEQNIHRWLNASLYPDTTSYTNENILTHEFGHAVKLCGIDYMTDKTLSNLIKTTYSNVRSKGLWDNTYAATNIDEYFATLTNIWFGSQSEVRTTNGTWGPINTRAELKVYDPESYALFEQIYPKTQMPSPWNLKHNSYDHSNGVTDPDTLDSSTIEYNTNIWKYGDSDAVDKSDLVIAINRAKSYAEEDYSEETFAALAAAIKAAEEINKNSEATQSEVDEAVNNINSAIDNLMPSDDSGIIILDKLETATRASWTEYETNGSKWTNEGMNAWSSKYNIAYDILWGDYDRDSLTQSYVNQITNELNAAVEFANSTIPGSGDFEALAALIKKANEINKNLYTSESVAAFETALSEANTVAKNTNATKADTDAVIDKLNKAIEGLEISSFAQSVTSDKDAYLVNENITLTIVTSESVKNIGVTSYGSGKFLGKSYQNYVDENGLTTWTVKVALGTKGQRTLEIWITEDGENFKRTDLTVSMKVTNAIADPTQEVKIISADKTEASAMVDEKMTLTVTTTTGVTKLGVFNENGAGVSSTKTYKDENGVRVWTLSFSVRTKGQRTLTIKAGNDDGFVNNGAITFSATISRKK